MSDPQIDPAAIAIQAGQQRVWNDTARDFSNVTAIAAPAAEVISDRLIALAHVAAGQRVLDIATGVGDPALTAARIVGPSGRWWASTRRRRCWWLPVSAQPRLA